MSRAFISEEAADKSAAALPERPVSIAPNLVTRRGLELIEAEVARLTEQLDHCPPENPGRPAIARDLRYWKARRTSAQLIGRTPAQEAGFGSVVRISRDGAETTYKIVGEDEADPPRGLLSWTSPMARALMGARAGDVVEPGEGRPAVTVVSVGE